MTEAPSAFAALMPQTNQSGEVFETGDVALLLKADGRVQALNIGIDAKVLKEKTPEQMTPDERAMLEQGRKLFALSLAATNPQIMDMLLEMSSDPDIVDPEMLKQYDAPN